MDSAKHLPLHIACNHIHSIDPDILLFLMEKDPDAIQKLNKHGWLPYTKLSLVVSQSPTERRQYQHVDRSLPRSRGKKTKRCSSCCIWPSVNPVQDVK